LLIACDIHPLNNLAPLNYLRKQMGRAKTRSMPGTGTGSARDWRRSRRWSSPGRVRAITCMGEQVTMADVCLVPQMANAAPLQLRSVGLPALIGIDAACKNPCRIRRRRGRRNNRTLPEPAAPGLQTKFLPQRIDPALDRIAHISLGVQCVSEIDCARCVHVHQLVVRSTHE